MSYKEELFIDAAKVITLSEHTGKELAKKFGLKLLPFEAYAPGRYLLAVLDELEKMDRVNKLTTKFSCQLRIALRKPDLTEQEKYARNLDRATDFDSF